MRAHLIHKGEGNDRQRVWDRAPVRSDEIGHVDARGGHCKQEEKGQDHGAE